MTDAGREAARLQIEKVNAICWKIYLGGVFVGAENSELRAKFKANALEDVLRKFAANTTTLAPRDSDGSTETEHVEGIGSAFKPPTKSVEYSEAGRVMLSGVQDHADKAQIVGGDSITTRAYNEAYAFMHEWLKRVNPKAASNHKITLRIRRNRLAALLADFAAQRELAARREERRRSPHWVPVGESVPAVGAWCFEDEQAPDSGYRTSNGVIVQVGEHFAFAHYHESSDDHGKTICEAGWTVRDWHVWDGRDIHREIKPSRWLFVAEAEALLDAEPDAAKREESTPEWKAKR